MEQFTKITKEMLCNGRDDVQKLLVDKVKTHTIALCADTEDYLLYSLADCESPIEQLLALYMEYYGLEHIDLYNPSIKSLEIHRQCEAFIGGEKYRADFLIEVVYRGKHGEYNVNFVVECDGYDFHQKNKKQVEYDNTRTRNLQRAGYEVIHFSGTEIWNQTSRCIKELVSIILSKCEK